MTLLEAVADLLRGRRTPFAVVGAVAMAVHGVSRATRDLDLLAVERACLTPSYWEPLVVAGVAVTIHPGDDDDPLAGVVRLQAGSEPPVDVLVGKSPWQLGILARASDTDLGGVAAPVARRADLILLKLYAGGPQDAWDIEQLLSVVECSAVVAEVEQHLPELPADCQRLWTRIRGAAS